MVGQARERGGFGGLVGIGGIVVVSARGSAFMWLRAWGSGVVAVGLVAFTSVLRGRMAVHDSRRTMLDRLRGCFAIGFISCQSVRRLAGSSFDVVFVTAKKMRELIVRYFRSLPHPTVVLTSKVRGSLTTTLRVSS